jgi:hypothetical protein
MGSDPAPPAFFSPVFSEGTGGSSRRNGRRKIERANGASLDIPRHGRLLPVFVRLVSAARPQYGRDDNRVLHVPPGSHQRSPGKTTSRTRRGSGWRLGSTDWLDRRSEYRQGRWGWPRTPPNVRKRLILRRLIPRRLILRQFGLPSPCDLLHHVVEQQYGANNQDVPQFRGDAFHGCIPYARGVSERSSPVSAISSRITVSACKFFMR